MESEEAIGSSAKHDPAPRSRSKMYSRRQSRTAERCSPVARRAQTFGSGFSTIASMTRSAVFASAIVPVTQVRRGIPRRPVRAPSSRGQSLPARRDRLESPLEAGGIGVHQRRLDAGLGNDLSNAAAHSPRADDEDSFDCRGLRVRRRLAHIQRPSLPRIRQPTLARLYVPRPLGTCGAARFSVLQLEAPIHSPIQGHDCSDSWR